MYLTRGQPVIYYGDEQGFIGTGGDKDARQDMFATKVASTTTEVVHDRHARGSKDRYDTDSPLYKHIAELSELRAANPALADGAQVHRYASDGAGIYAVQPGRRAGRSSTWSWRTTRPRRKTATFATYSDREALHADLRAATHVRTGREGRVDVTVPPLSVSVWKAGHGSATRKAPRRLPHARRQPAVPSAAGPRSAPRSPANAFAEVTFAYRPVGHDGLDSGSAPTTTRRTACSTTSRATRQGHAGRVPRGRQGQQRQLLGRLVVRHRRRPGTPAAAAAAAGRPGHPAGQRQRAGRPQHRDGLRRATGSRTATRPS